MTRIWPAICSIGFLIATPSASLAEEGDGYSAFVQAVASDEIALRTFDQEIVASFKALFDHDRELLEMEAECPGIVDGLTAAIRPTLLKSHLSDYDWFRRKMGTLLRSKMTVDEAAQAALFFESDVGQRFLGNVIEKRSTTNTFDELLADENAKTVSKEAIDADRKQTAAQVVETMSTADKLALNNAMTGTEWGRKFIQMRPEMEALNHEFVNLEFSAEEDAEIDNAIEAFADSHIEACYGDEDQ